MPEPLLTVVSFCLGYAALYGYRRNDTAVSPDAKTTVSAVIGLAETRSNSQVLFGAKSAAISSVRQLIAECGDDDWDANESKAVNPSAVWIATDFIRALPDNFPMPEAAAEPDGSVSLDWMQSRNRMFSLSVDNGNRLAYAWLDGTERGHGVLNFDGVNLPSRFISEISPIVQYGKAGFRAS